MRINILRQYIYFNFMLLVFFTLLQNSMADTQIPAGNVSGQWSLKNSPYLVNGEITIPNDSSLIIEAGVNVILTGSYQINIQGRIIAAGTENDTISFIAQDVDSAWNGLKFQNTPATNDTSKLIYCKIRDVYVMQSGVINGGAISVKGFNKLLIAHCLITQNTITGDLHSAGAGLYIDSCSPLIANNIISYNAAPKSHGGGVAIVTGSNPVFINNIIFKNHATGGAGILIADNSNPVFINNTIVKNQADLAGDVVNHAGAVDIIGCHPVFVNTILFANSAAVGSQIHFQNGGQADFYFCDIENGEDGFARNLVNGGSFSGIYNSNIKTDPLFTNSESDDYNLSENSPCISSGTDSVFFNGKWNFMPSYDINGNPRPNPVGTIPDIGALESDEGHVYIPTSIEDLTLIADGFQLLQNYPNPFNPKTEISYMLPVKSDVKITIFNDLGQQVRTLVDQLQKAGSYTVGFNAANLPSGLYIYNLQTNTTRISRKMILIK